VKKVWRVTCFGVKGVAYGAATGLGKNWEGGGGLSMVVFLGNNTTHKRIGRQSKCGRQTISRKVG
jgi:hypothetical protein